MKNINLIAFSLILMASSVGAGEITLKQSFWTGWHYSVDGLSYGKVGVSGKLLRDAMAGNEAAQREIDRYKSRNILARVTGIPGGVLIGWPLGALIAGSEWNDTYTTMYIIGIPLSLASLILEDAASRHLRIAVSIYNGEEQFVGFDVKWRSEYASTNNGTLMVGVAWNF